MIQRTTFKGTSTRPRLRLRPRARAAPAPAPAPVPAPAPALRPASCSSIADRTEVHERVVRQPWREGRCLHRQGGNLSQRLGRSTRQSRMAQGPPLASTQPRAGRARAGREAHEEHRACRNHCQSRRLLQRRGLAREGPGRDAGNLVRCLVREIAGVLRGEGGRGLPWRVRGRQRWRQAWDRDLCHLVHTVPAHVLRGPDVLRADADQVRCRSLPV
jgi:hypothetical protein